MKFQLLLIFLIAAVISIIFIIWSQFVYPVPASDAMFFITPAINFKTYGKLTSPFGAEIPETRDISGKKRFLFYTPLFPLFLGIFMPTASPQGAFLIIAFINTIVLFISSFLFYKVLLENRQVNLFNFIYVILGILGVASYLNGHEGRPEILARLFLIIGAFVSLYVDKKYLWIPFGLLLGFIGLAHPAGAIFSAIFIAIFYSYFFDTKKALSYISIVYFVSLLVFIFGIAMGPFSMADTVSGIIQHYQLATVPTNFDFNLLKYFYFLSSLNFGIGIIIIFSFISTVLLFHNYYNNIKSRPLFYLFVATLLLLSFYFILFRSLQVFYLRLFIPFMFLAILYYMVIRRPAFSVKLLLLCVLALGSVNFLRNLTLFPFFLNKGLSLSAARESFGEFQSKTKNVFYIDTDLWVLSENYENMRLQGIFPKDNFMVVTKGFNLQNNFLNKCVNIFDVSTKEIPRVFGIKLANTMPSHGFLVYDCNKKY